MRNCKRVGGILGISIAEELRIYCDGNEVL